MWLENYKWKLSLKIDKRMILLFKLGGSIVEKKNGYNKISCNEIEDALFFIVLFKGVVS